MVCTVAFMFGGKTVSKARAEEKRDNEARLKFVLVLTRHGVRSPTWSNSRLDEYAKDPWPKWGVEPGELTVHGRLLMPKLGINIQHFLQGLGWFWGRVGG